MVLALAADPSVAQDERRQQGAARLTLQKSRESPRCQLGLVLSLSFSLSLLRLTRKCSLLQHDPRSCYSASSHPAPPCNNQTLLDFRLFFLDDDRSVQPAVALPKHAVQASPPLAPSTGIRRRSRKHSPRQSALALLGVSSTPHLASLTVSSPQIRINSLSEETGCEILGKAEFMNPGGSVKDRAALGLVKWAENTGTCRTHARATCCAHSRPSQNPMHAC